ncbi:General transcription factor IIH subunit 5 [Actinomortierella ambigua]|uniref:General transcription and DNA repair factor IIH subunit TFB5 n=1 Tax=Actinomortierella ambigua TaxID=1343610 RepID=A0A9P6Q5S7_9FUNG|nr:General transcription factor IIH subunit 5 [Actinomortierella ambigua]KAG0261198.1 General transcription factor IIH subunit 5 [Actinomortierella ambigua]
MVKAVKGVVIKCDTSVKEIILGLNQHGNFILEDLDETHVFVDASCVEQLRVDIDQILNENTYNVEEANK